MKLKSKLIHILSAVAVINSAGEVAAQEDVSFPEESMIGCYPLNGDLKDLSGKGNHGKLVKDTDLESRKRAKPEYRTDRFGREVSAYNFWGRDLYAYGAPVLPIDLSPSKIKEVTVCCWAKAEFPATWGVAKGGKRNPGSTKSVFNTANGSGRALLLGNDSPNPTEKTEFGWSGALGNDLGVFNTKNYQHQAWTFVSIVYKEDEVILYVDDKEYRSKCSSMASTDDMWIGREPVPGKFYDTFMGGIDDIFVFEKALSKEEVILVKDKGASWIDTKLGGGEKLVLPLLTKLNSANGTEISATVTEVKKDSLELILENGKQTTVGFSKLSEKDQERFRKVFETEEKLKKFDSLKGFIYNGSGQSLVAYNGSEIKLNVDDFKWSDIKTMTHTPWPESGSTQIDEFILIEKNDKKKLFLNRDWEVFYEGSAKTQMSTIDILSDNDKKVKAMLLVDDHRLLVKSNSEETLIDFEADEKSIDRNRLELLDFPELAIGHQNIILWELKRTYEWDRKKGYRYGRWLDGSKSYYTHDGKLLFKGSNLTRLSVIDPIMDESDTQTADPSKLLYFSDRGNNESQTRIMLADGTMVYESNFSGKISVMELLGEDGEVEKRSYMEVGTGVSLINHPDGRKITLSGWEPIGLMTPDGVLVYRGGKYALVGYDGKLLIPPLYSELMKYVGEGRYEVEVDGNVKTITIEQ